MGRVLDDSLPPRVRVRLDLAYDGTDFFGWAMQPERRTVQATLEEGLARVLRPGAPEPGARIATVVAGRTDTGVHARGQVAHIDIAPQQWEALPGHSGRQPAQALADRLAGVLPRDLVVRRASWAPIGFDARFSATERVYRYRVCDRIELRDPLARRHVLWVSRPLDVERMAQAARAIVGLHDFAAFAKPRPGGTTIRDLRELAWRREESGPDAGLVVVTARADAFAHNMVRSLVGACVLVGQGRRPPEWVAEKLASGVREGATGPAPARGLTLEAVEYPADAELAARAERIRARRVL